MICILKADKMFNEEIKHYDMLVLPGGRSGGQNLLENQDVIHLFNILMSIINI